MMAGPVEPVTVVGHREMPLLPIDRDNDHDDRIRERMEREAIVSSQNEPQPKPPVDLGLRPVEPYRLPKQRGRRRRSI